MPDRRRSLVFCVVVLILTGMTLPTTAIQPQPGTEAGLPDSVESKTDSTSAVRNDTPVERKRVAIAKVESMDVGWRFQARQRERAVDRLNGTLPAYREGYRVSSRSVFRDDRRALGALRPIAWTDPTAAEEAADLVVSADLATVNTSIDDARIALERTRARVEEPRDRRRAERAIDRAARSRDRGLRTLREDDWRAWRSTKRQRALVDLGLAWLHAKHAMDVLERASDPVVTIETRSDPARNGSGPVGRTIRGNVTDVRAYELGNVTVAVDGNVVGRTPLDGVPAPGRNASFAANVTLARPVANVTVTVTDVDSRAPSWLANDDRWVRFDRRRDRATVRGSWGRFDRSRSRSGGRHDRSDTDVVRFDGDGLPDAYEVEVVGTDPLDPDSDSSVTDADEAKDGVPDGGEDFDEDRLVTYAEYELGTDPFSNDTDGDGLPDRFESSLPALLDPTDPDTNGDGVADGAEDFDGDGLPVADEYANETSVASADSDRDGLDDTEEVRIHGTSPLDIDTDDDGLGDGEELRLGTDPLVADTDGDGVVDGNETYRTSTRDEATGVNVSLSGGGDLASRVDVEEVTQPPGTDFLAGPVVRVRNRTDFGAATVTIPLAGNVSPAKAGNLSVYTWSADDDRPWHPVASTVDVANGTASADVSSFSFFTVMDEPEWEDAITDTITHSWPRHESFDDLDGWEVDGDAGVADGNLVVSASKEVELDPDIVVATDGSGDFERIQSAVDAAAENDTILVEEGRYGESVDVDVSVRLVGRNATLDGGVAAGDDGLRIVGNASPSISGFTITGFDDGIKGRSEASEVRVSEVVLRDNRWGLDLRRSGRWVLDGVTIVDNDDRGVFVPDFTGELRLSNSELSRNGRVGLHLTRFTGSATIADTEVTSHGSEVRIERSECECRFQDVDIAGGRNGIFVLDNPRLLRLEDVEIRQAKSGIYVKKESNVVLSDVDLIDNQYGIYADRTAGRFELSDVDIVGDGFRGSFGLKAILSSANWSLEAVTVTDNGYAGISGEQTSGTWTLGDVKSTDNGRDGLNMEDSTGTWLIARSAFVSNALSGVQASGATGEVEISRTEIRGNGQAGVEASNANPPIDASENWWGQATGPDPTQTNGNVLTDPHCESPECSFDSAAASDVGQPDYRPRSSPWHVDSHRAAVERNGGRSTARRVTDLPGDVADITVTARVKGRVADGSSARVLVTGDSGEAVVADVASTGERFRTQSTELDRFAGETVTVEAVAEGDAEIAVDWIDFAVDTDGDGLRDAVERAELGMPTGPRPGAPLASLDPSTPDTDGDGLLDGEELTDVTVEHDSSGLAGSLSFRAVAAAADPTQENSDGGGLNDSEELAAGSDPFVLETLVMGYTIPTMTEGPEETLEDRNPMTVGEVNGLQAGAGRDSDVIAWPSRQYSGRLFCIKQLTAGPGCSEAWMQGVELQDDKFYVYVPFVVYAQSNVDFGEVPYELSLTSHPDANVVKAVNTTGMIGSGNSRSGYIVYELSEDTTGFELQRRIFRPLGMLTLDADISNTVFERSEPPSISRRYTVSTSTTLPRTEQMLQDTQFVLEQGINVAFAAEAGYSVAIETGSGVRGALAFLYHLAQSQVSTPPTSIEDVAEKVSQKGIAAFEEKVVETQGDIDDDIFGDGVVRTVGPTIIRQN